MAWFLPALGLSALRAGMGAAGGEWKSTGEEDIINRLIGDTTRMRDQIPSESLAEQLASNQSIGTQSREAKAISSSPQESNQIDLTAGANEAASRSGIIGKYANKGMEFQKHLGDLTFAKAAAHKGEKERQFNSWFQPLSTGASIAMSGMMKDIPAFGSTVADTATKTDTKPAFVPPSNTKSDTPQTEELNTLDPNYQTKKFNEWMQLHGGLE